MMASSRKKLILNSTIYFTGNMLTKVVSFLLLPVYTKLFSPAEYGVWGTLVSFTAMLTPFFQLGLHDAVGRFYYRYFKDENSLKKYFSTIFIALSAVTLILEGLLILFSPYFSMILLGNKAYLLIIVLLILDIGFSSFVQLFTNLFQYGEKAVQFSVIQFTKSVLNLSLIILLVVYFKIGILGFAVSMLIVDLIFFVICAYIFRRLFAFGINTAYLKESISYGMPFFLMAILGWIASYSSILYVTKLQSPYYAGLFSMAFNISTVVGLVCASIQQVWNPIFMKNLEAKTENFTHRIIQFQTVYMALVGLIGILVSLGSKEFFEMFLNPRYHSAWVIMPILMYYYLFSSMAQQFYLKICFVQKTGYLFYINFVTAAVSIATNIILIKNLPVAGAALSMVIIVVITAFTYYYFSQRHMPVNYEYKKMFFILLAFMAGTAGSFMFHFPTGYNLLVKGLLFLLLLLFLIKMESVPYKEIKNLIKEFRGIKKADAS